MENLTHTLVGLMLSRAGLNRLTPRAAPLLMLAANLPDIDVVTASGGALTYLDNHRAITHALLASPLVAAASVLLVRLAGPLPFLRAWIAAMVAVLSHLALDWTNTYGIRMLLPFSGEWLRLDITNVVDVVIWAVLLLAVAGALLSKLVSSEIGAKPGNGRGAAIFALLFLTLYEGGRWILHERAITTLNSHIYSGGAPRRVAAFPHFASPFLWTALVEGRGFVSLQRINLLQTYDSTAGQTYFDPDPSPLLDAARQTDTFRRFLQFAQFPYWRTTPVDRPEGGVKVEVMDLRFGEPDEPRFVATAIFDSGRRLVEESFSFGPVRLR